MAAQTGQSIARGLALATATFLGIEIAKWAATGLPEWQRLTLEFVGGLIGYYLAAVILGRFPTVKRAP